VGLFFAAVVGVIISTIGNAVIISIAVESIGDAVVILVAPACVSDPGVALRNVTVMVPPLELTSLPAVPPIMPMMILVPIAIRIGYANIAVVEGEGEGISG
jgi:hypothetical protein